MYLLEKNSYEKVESMFEKMLDYETSIRWAFRDNNAPCQIYVDDLMNPKSCFIAMTWGFCYFGGKYNEQFVEVCLKNKFTEPNMYCIFADNETLEEIDKKMPVKCEHGHGLSVRGRLYYKLNVEKFLNNKLSLKELPENYELELITEKENEKVILMCNDKEIGHCTGGYKEKVEEINFDIFLEEEHRNKGIGSLVCAKLIEYHLAQNHDYITWGCFPINVPSVKCAEKLGFEEVYAGNLIFCFA